MDLIGKRISPQTMKILYAEPFTSKSLERDFDIRGGEWSVQEGWLTGKNPNNAPGMLISRIAFRKNIMLDFRARTVLPSTHDIDVMWNGSWDFSSNKRCMGYIMGLEGWWDGKVGFEKAPDYKLTAATSLFIFEPGRIYHVQCGNVDGHLFCIVDGNFVLELIDLSLILFCHTMPLVNRKSA